MSRRTTKIIMIVDQSGSMEIIRRPTVRGVEDFIRDLNALPGRGLWTLVFFDDAASALGAGELFPRIIFEDRDSQELPEAPMALYRPRGSTALVDALYIVLTRARADYLRTPEALRPRMLVIIQTDGKENASHQHTHAELRRLTAELQGWGWEFIYLGANQDAFAVRQDLGFKKITIVPYAANQADTKRAYRYVGHVARAWKTDGNQSAADLLSSASPEIAPNPDDKGLQA